MNKEKLKKVFSFIGKLVLLVLLTYSAIVSTIGCFNSLSRNIYDSPNKVQDVKRAYNSDNLVNNVFNGFSNAWYNSGYYTNMTNLGSYYMGSTVTTSYGFVTNDCLTIGADYLISFSISRQSYEIYEIQFVENPNFSSSSSIIFSGVLSSNQVFNFNYIYHASYSCFGIKVSGRTSNGSTSYLYVSRPFITPYSNDVNSAYNSGYSIGYDEGYELGNSEGYDYGYSVGEGYVQSHPHNYDLYTKDEYDNAYDSGYDVGVMESYDVGYNAGFGAGATDVVNRELAENGFIKLANIVFNAPYNILHNSFNFQFLGINLWALMSFVFTIALVFGVIGFLKRR